MINGRLVGRGGQCRRWMQFCTLSVFYPFFVFVSQGTWIWALIATCSDTTFTINTHGHQRSLTKVTKNPKCRDMMQPNLPTWLRCVTASLPSGSPFTFSSNTHHQSEQNHKILIEIGGFHQLSPTWSHNYNLNVKKFGFNVLADLLDIYMMHWIHFKLWWIY